MRNARTAGIPIALPVPVAVADDSDDMANVPAQPLADLPVQCSRWRSRQQRKCPQPLVELALQAYFQWQRQWHAEYRRVRIRRSHERFLEFRERHNMSRADTQGRIIALRREMAQVVAEPRQLDDPHVALGDAQLLLRGGEVVYHLGGEVTHPQ